MKFIVSPYPQLPTSPWKLEIKASFAGKKIRRFFKKEGEAWEEGERITGQIRERGVSSITSEGITVENAVKRFNSCHSFKGSHKMHMNRNLDLFVEKYRKRGIASIGPVELVDFWNREEWPEGRATRRQAFAYLRIFFNWLERYDIVERNPTRRVDPPKAPAPLRNILQPDEMKAALKLAGDDVRAKAFLCLGGFAGLRSEEIFALSSSDMDFESKEIHVSDGKTGERYVKMEEAFIRHCPREWEKSSKRNWYNRLEPLKLTRNCLRHSFATYHLAVCRDAGKTAHEMGHSSPRMASRVYALAAKRADAAAWWGL